MLWGLWVNHANSGDYVTALALANEYVELATSQADHSGLLMADSTALITQFLPGDLAQAQLSRGAGAVALSARWRSWIGTPVQP